ncbi:MAG: hypothetical protein NTX53_18565 [candidate division WOR-3 bacterium]|nr:hypothetical protein [candidate division WOR-3 bacterium]
MARRLVDKIEVYLRRFDRERPFPEHAIDLHLETLRLRRHHSGPLRELVGRRDFVVALYATLIAWGMGRRNVQLVGLDKFAKGLRKIARTPEFTELSRETLASLGRDAEKVAGKIWTLVEALDPTKSKSKLVAGTKTLHHIFPDLVPPIDRKYTGGFFSMRFSNSTRHAADFSKVFCLLAYAANRVRKSQSVRKRLGRGMHTSLPKVLDNALVGKSLRHRTTGREA